MALRSDSLTSNESDCMRLYKFRRLKGATDADVNKLRVRILDIVNSKRLFCEEWQQFPDKYEGAYISFAGLTPDDINVLGKSKLRSNEEYFAEVERRGLIKKSWDNYSRVCSLARGPLSNECMWKEYADDGAGVAIELVVHACATIPFQKVAYAKGKKMNGVRNVFGVLADANGNIEFFSDQLLKYKVQDYVNENEVRLVCKQSELLPPPFTGDVNDKLALCEYKFEMSEAGKNCYYDFSKVMEVVKVWCGERISDDDYAYLNSHIQNVPVVKYQS